VGAEAAGDLPRLWHNFGATAPLERSREIVRRAFELGITHFDLANNYGPPYGSAEETFGQALRKDLASHRDEIVVSTKAGRDMWPGPLRSLPRRAARSLRDPRVAP
jgi:L-glyceraldehyde 3-phosphate reductase